MNIPIPFGGSLSVRGTELPFPSHPPRTLSSRTLAAHEGHAGGFWTPRAAPQPCIHSVESAELRSDSTEAYNPRRDPVTSCGRPRSGPPATAGIRYRASLYLLSPRSGSRPAPCLPTCLHSRVLYGVHGSLLPIPKPSLYRDAPLHLQQVGGLRRVVPGTYAHPLNSPPLVPSVRIHG